MKNYFKYNYKCYKIRFDTHTRYEMIYDLNEEFHFVLYYLFIYCSKQIKRNLKEEKKNFKLCKKNLFRTEFSHT
jgi:hypothetical protein